MNSKITRGFIFAFLASVVSPAFAQTAGSLDAQFGTGGIAQTSFTSSSTANAALLQADGKIVLGGTYTSGGLGYMAFSRYNSNGTPDNTFGTNGKFTLGFPVAGVKVSTLQTATGGKIIAAGSSDNKPAIVRMTAAGAADATFGINGVVEFDANMDGILDLVVLANGKMLGCGVADLGAGKVFATFRRNADGTPDNTYGTNGFSYTTVGDQALLTKMAVQSDGKILLTGTVYFDATKYDLVLVRLTANGAPDNTFDADGKVTTVLGTNAAYEQGFAVKVQQDNKIVVLARIANAGPTIFSVVRYNANGSLDNTFDGNGSATINFNNEIDEPRALAIQTDGKIIAVGSSVVGATRLLAVARLTKAGAPDNTFDTDGKVTTTIGTKAYGEAVLLQPDAKIVVGGYALVGSANQFAVARYNAGTVVGTQEAEAGLQDLQVFPNPARAGAPVSLKFELNEAQPCRFFLFSIDGRLLHSYPVHDLPAGKNALTFDLPADLPAGQSVLKIETGTGQVAIPMLIQPR